MIKSVTSFAVLGFVLIASSGEAYAGHCRSGSNSQRIRCLNNEVAYLTAKYKQAEIDIVGLQGRLATAEETLKTLTNDYKTLLGDHSALEQRVDVIDASLRGAVKYGTHLKMRSLKWDNKCLSQTHADSASAENCDTAPRWFLFE